MNEKRSYMEKDWDWFDSKGSVDTSPIQISNGLYFLWSTNMSALQESYDISSISGQVGLIAWWLVNGKHEYTELDIEITYDDILFEPADIYEPGDLYPISRIALATAQLNEYFLEGVDFGKIEDRIRLNNWYYGSIVKKTRELSSAEILFFSEAAPDIAQDVYLPITYAMMFCWHGRKDLQVSFDLSDKAGRMGFEVWWLRGGYKDVVPYELAESQRQVLFEKAPDIEQDTLLPITRVMMIGWHSRNDLQVAFDLSIKQGRLEFEHWWALNQNQFYFNYTDSVSHSSAESNSITVHDESNQENEDIKHFGGYSENGINLIGLVKGELGIGEDLRMAARAMEKADIKFSVFNFPRKSFSRQSDLSFAHLIQDELVYNVNMVNLTGFEHASLFSTYGKKVFDKRFTIGAWPWELPEWPVLCRGVYNLVDEIWASSRFAVKAYSDSPVPVVYMPMTVDFDSVPQYTRSDFGLPTNVYLFLYVFDGLSYMSRKNPIAHIQAFWNAFPRSQKDVGLVVKTMNVNLDNETWNTFHKMAASDDRIYVIAETLPKDKVLGLMNNCDAFLSLHRAEGFGRCIAEMMWLGKPVIVTNFSGNTDFTTSDTAFLVDGPMISVEPGEYPYGDGQYWCDPDIWLAAEHMRVCFERGDLVDKIAQAGNRLIRRDYSVEAVSEKYKERFRELGMTF